MDVGAGGSGDKLKFYSFIQILIFSLFLSISARPSLGGVTFCTTTVPPLPRYALLPITVRFPNPTNHRHSLTLISRRRIS